MNQLQKTLNVSHTLKETARKFNNREAIVSDERRITYGELEIVHAAVIGLPDEIYGEISCACVVLKETSSLLRKSIYSFPLLCR
ncbi:AMP-binding enzyme [Siminovitchia sp. 179-K 8D1 HS]|uniref:AMP-binding enzyme n=1 Tax=Siminovitchia sp. 179-K 8D1 HS TaxID=3142385 RepID=UPI0039A13586